MKCRSAESLFSSMIEDELSQEERRAIEAHLLACRRCSIALRDLRATMSLVRSLPEVAPGPHFEEDLFARMRSGEGLNPSLGERLRGLVSSLSPRPILATGAAACAVWVAVALLHPGRVGTISAVGPIASSVPTSPARELSSAPAPDVDPGTPRPDAAPAMLAARSPASAEAAPGASQRPGASEGAPRSVATRGELLRSALAADDSAATGDRLEPPYQDEYILDQFLLDRVGPQGPAIVPVQGRGDGGVTITF